MKVYYNPRTDILVIRGEAVKGCYLTFWVDQEGMAVYGFLNKKWFKTNFLEIGNF